tara:strand:- start:109 stop:297 length:189 start_codon:yes stop_codon:yes gene_type:complete
MSNLEEKKILDILEKLSDAMYSIHDANLCLRLLNFDNIINFQSKLNEAFSTCDEIYNFLDEL